MTLRTTFRLQYAGKQAATVGAAKLKGPARSGQLLTAIRSSLGSGTAFNPLGVSVPCVEGEDCSAALVPPAGVAFAASAAAPACGKFDGACKSGFFPLPRCVVWANAGRWARGVGVSGCLSAGYDSQGNL
jgi:hypothetical protein